MNLLRTNALAFAKLRAGAFLLACLLINPGCEQADSEFLAIKKIQLESDKPLFLENLSKPYAMKILPESELILISQNSGDYWVSVYDLNGKFQGEFIKNGLGPDEQLINISLTVDEENRKIYSFDVEKNFLYTYSLDSIRSGAFNNSLISDTKLRNIQLNQPVFVNENQFIDFITQNNDNNTALAKFDSMGNVAPFGTLPSYSHNIPYQIYTEAFFGNLELIDGNILINYFWSDYIQKYETSGNELRSIHGPDHFIPFYEMRANGNSIQPVPDFEKARFGYLSRISKFGKKIALGYSGKFLSEGEGFRKVFIFDTDLNPMAEYNLNTSLLFFDIYDNTLLGYSSENEGAIIRFDLDDFD